MDICELNSPVILYRFLTFLMFEYWFMIPLVFWLQLILLMSCKSNLYIDSIKLLLIYICQVGVNIMMVIF